MIDAVCRAIFTDAGLTRLAGVVFVAGMAIGAYVMRLWDRTAVRR